VSRWPVPSENLVSSLQIASGPQSRRSSGVPPSKTQYTPRASCFSAHRWLITTSATHCTPALWKAAIRDLSSAAVPYLDASRSYSRPGM
jgi:hypothetical protein